MEELKDFEFFKKNQLAAVNFETGQIDVWAVGGGGLSKYVRKNVGSKNPDGYYRMWCHKKLRMKHRLLYWLYHNEMPEEIDHIDGNRQNNNINNLRSVNRKEQLKNINKPANKYTRFNFKKSHLIRVLRLQKMGKSTTQIAKDIGCSRATIKDLFQGKRKHYNQLVKAFQERESSTTKHS